MIFSVHVEVRLREGIADPQGSTIERALPTLGFDGVREVPAYNSNGLWLQSDPEALGREAVALVAEGGFRGLKLRLGRERLDAFLRRVRSMGKRCVRVVHGKGKTSEGKLPVLKGKVNVWLRQKDEVMAFCSAIPRDGGGGAVYVLLKRIG